ncbi:MAG: hypothetical protein PVH61_06060 [Candidatus Aminicenantes bacterium]
MKKTLFFVLTLALTLTFCFSRPLEGKNKDRYLAPELEPGAIKTQTPGDTRGRRERNLKLLRHMQELSTRCSSALKTVCCDTPSQTDFQVLVDSVYMQPEDGEEGPILITGLCKNLEVDQAVLIFIAMEFFDINDKSLGHALGMVYGDKNLRVPAEEEGTLCVWAMEKGDTGFFGASTSISTPELNSSSIELIHSYTATFTYGTSTSGTLPHAYTQLSLENLDYQSWNGKLKITAEVKNSSSNYGSSPTMVGIAVFDDTNTKVIDAAASYAGGTSSAGYNWSVYPGESESVDIYFNYAENDLEKTGDAYRTTYLFYEGEINYANDMSGPFGVFATPVDGAAVSGSIPVTGWVLDDIAMKSVKIYVEQGGGLLYVGDANFSEGARSDIEAAYPDYPNNSKAGWGYMLLTNFLPNGGNGTYKLYAIAEDRTGKSTTLGTKTIFCDNANAVKPFGAIDTPDQGGIAFGSEFVVWGWALTPPSGTPPCEIPTNGSTINVWVDGVKLGNPTYNQYRADIAALFPGYANTDGAAGYFVLDTTAYEDGVHTIQWTVKDDCQRTDGIGSRYFCITNGEDDLFNTAGSKVNGLNSGDISSIPVNRRNPLKIRKGFAADKPYITLAVENAAYNIEIKELERIEVHLQGAPLSEYSGYLVCGNQLRPLPIGSKLDNSKGIFSWMPGLAFLGDYRLVFIETAPDSKMSCRKYINIKIVPEY